MAHYLAQEKILRNKRLNTPDFNKMAKKRREHSKQAAKSRKKNRKAK